MKQSDEGKNCLEGGVSECLGKRNIFSREE
jgi:hypothetical protein